MNPSTPADGAVLTLTAGVPADGVILGLTEAGWKIGVTYTETSEEADETTVPFNKIVDVETMKAECSMFQAEDFGLLKLFTPTGTFAAVAAHEKITFGGAAVISSTAKPGLLIVARQTESVRYVYVQIYQAINTAGVEFELTRKKSARVPVSMEALSQTARTAGDQAGAFVKFLT